MTTHIERVECREPLTRIDIVTPGSGNSLNPAVIEQAPNRDLQRDHARATHLPAGYEPKPARHIEWTSKETPCELL